MPPLRCQVPAQRGRGREADLVGDSIHRQVVEHDQAGMRAVAELAGQGKLRAHIAGTFPLADGARAHALGETGRTTGKLVITVR